MNRKYFAIILLLATRLWAQTGAYTLNGGTTNISTLTENTATADQSGIFVYNAGSLTVGTVTVWTGGDASSTDNSDKYGINAGILAGTSNTIGKILITGSGNSIITTGAVANGVFATLTGSSLTMSGGVIIASGVNAHGVDATYGGAVTLVNVNVTTSNANSSAVATDFGGGTVFVTGGTIIAADTVAGSHSAAIYSTGLITVNNATATSKADCGGVIDGANSIILSNTALTGVVEGFKLWKTAPASGAATVTVTSGSITVTAGDAFYVTGTTGNASTGVLTVKGGATINASTGNILNVDSNSTAVLTLNGETLTGNLYADSTSTITATLTNNTTLLASLNRVALTLDSTSTWNQNANSVLTSLTNFGTISGIGTVTATTVSMKSGATIAPGNLTNTFGSLTFSNSLTLSNATLTIGLNSLGGTCDVLNVIGALSITNSTLRLVTTGGLVSNVYVFATYSNLVSSNSAFTKIYIDGALTSATLSYNYNNLEEIALVIPEPNTLTLVVLGLAGLFVPGRFRRKLLKINLHLTPP